MHTFLLFALPLQYESPRYKWGSEQIGHQKQCNLHTRSNAHVCGRDISRILHRRKHLKQKKKYAQANSPRKKLLKLKVLEQDTDISNVTGLYTLLHLGWSNYLHLSPVFENKAELDICAMRQLFYRLAVTHVTPEYSPSSITYLMILVYSHRPVKTP
jgi:hypothetical protein